MSTSEDFGVLFRARRKALGLSQSEFCRRNGFDKGNISRLERGLVPPPQDQQLLECYAKALKLESGTGEWERFFDLAAVATGRVPADLLEDQRAMRELPRLLRKARARGQRHATDVRALDLEGWADTLDSRATLPQLVRRLVRATGKPIRPIEFPSHEQGQRPGWDGIVEASEADEFVPADTSAWEMGVDKNIERKADEDFDKRTKAPGDLDTKRTTFIFVTPRRWQKKEEWRRAKEALGAWKEVRVYDSASLEEWLEQAPAVNAWLAGILGKKPPGITTLDDYWAALRAMTDPSLKPDVFLASREEQVRKVSEWLDGPPGAKEIAGRSPAEALDFVAAFSQGSPRAEWFAARALIVEDRNAWRALASSGAGLLLIAHPSIPVEPELVAEAVRQGHHVLLPSGLPSRKREAIKLPDAHRYDLEKALVSSGLEEERARRSAREAGGSLAVLKRLLGRLPGTIGPVWSRPSEASALMPMLLAGSWDETSEADRSAMARLSGRSYEVIAEIAERWRTATDAPLMRVGSRWSLVSRDDSWHLLASAVTRDALGRFKQVALGVLAEDDPAYQAPPDRRWMARLHPESPRYSQWLRAGLAETLAILGTRPGRLDEISELKAWSYEVDRVVQELLDNQDWVRWASLSDVLPLLAEAAPDAFLTAIERDLKRPEPALVELFEPESNTLLALNPRVWLLSALEVLAWSRDYLSPVSLILAALDEKAPRDALGNSAFRSLLYIFLPWPPQTSAPVEDRIRILKKLVKDRPEAAWRLLIGLLPNQQDTSTSIHRPLWRDWALGWSAQVAWGTIWQQVIACAGLLVEQLGDDISRWTDLIERFDDLPGPVQTEFLDHLKGLAESLSDEQGRRELADAIRKMVSWYRHSSRAGGELTEEVLSKLEDVQRRFEPGDPERRNAWLFESIWQLPVLLEGGEDRLQKLRRSAVREIFSQRGWSGVAALVEAVKAPETVGAAFAEIDSGEGEAGILPDLLVSSDDLVARFAVGYIRKRFHEEGWAWVDSLRMDGWSAEQVARFLLGANLPFERKTWELVASKGSEVSAKYWGRAEPRLSTQGKAVDEVRDEVRYAVEMLLRHQGPAAAVFAWLMALPNKDALDPDLLMEVLEAGVRTSDQMQNVVYGIPPLFQELEKRRQQNDPGVDFHRLARLEWAYLGLLDGHSVSPDTLRKLLREDPKSFVQVLGFVFRPRNESADDVREYSEEEKRRAENAYRLLRSWQDVPGSRDDRTVDERALRDWIQRARFLAEQHGLLEVCDSRIGEVLAHAPAEADGSWPCIPVRDLLEEIGEHSDEILQGWGVGILNKRGMYAKTLREGGDQERDLANKYRACADACKIEWPKTAEALRRIARSYEDEASREDERVMLD
jgi:transcriptional regulator with XRE-family HTH domain